MTTQTIPMLQSIEAALKSKAPVVAVPVEGRAPICVQSKHIKAALKGVEILSVEAGGEVVTRPSPYRTGEDTVTDSRYITIKGRVPCKPTALELERWAYTRKNWQKDLPKVPPVGTYGYVRTSVRLFAMSRAEAMKQNRDWAEKERRNRTKDSLLGALSPKARAEAKKAAGRAKIEAEMLQQANEARDFARRRVASSIAPVIAVPSRLSRETYSHHGGSLEHNTQAASDLVLFRATKRQRGCIGRIDKEIKMLRERVYEITGRKREAKRPGSYATVWKGRKRKLKGAKAVEYIALVSRLLALKAERAKIVAALPVRQEARYEWLTGSPVLDRPKFTYVSGRAPVYAPPALSFDRHEWAKDRKERASELAEALRVLRHTPEVTAETIAEAA